MLSNVGELCVTRVLNGRKRGRKESGEESLVCRSTADIWRDIFLARIILHERRQHFDAFESRFLDQTKIKVLDWCVMNGV